MARAKSGACSDPGTRLPSAVDSLTGLPRKRTNAPERQPYRRGSEDAPWRQALSTVPAIFDEKHHIDQKPDGHECREPDRHHQIEPSVIATHRSVVDHLMPSATRIQATPAMKMAIVRTPVVRVSSDSARTTVAAAAMPMAGKT